MRRTDLLLMALLAGLFLFAGCGQKEGGEETAGEAAVPALGSADTVAKGEPVWLDYEAGLAQAREEGKFVLIDFWTGWCHWCKVMDRETYRNEEVLRRLGEHFVTVKVNAESDDTQGDPATAPTGREIAREYQVSSYPTTWFIDSEGGRIGGLPGYVEPKQFVVVLDWIATDAYRTQSFQDYQSTLGG